MAADSAEVPVVASLVKAYASDVYFHVAAENIQIHGGIGFTWEHDAHLYFKRAKASELFLGDAQLPPRAAGPADRDLSGQRAGYSGPARDRIVRDRHNPGCRPAGRAA